MATGRQSFQGSAGPTHDPSSQLVTRSEMEQRLAAQRAEFEQRIQALEDALAPSGPPRPSPLSAVGRRIQKNRRLTAAVIAAFVGVWLIVLSWPGPLLGFDGDDVMNLYRAWSAPLGNFLVGNLFPFTTFYRPIGSLYYRFSFDIFGWNPQAFRVVTYGLMLTNLLLIYLLAKRLSRSAEAGVLAALLFTFHGRLKGIYLNNGTVYDVVCLTFTLLTLWYYVRMRQSRQTPRLQNYELAAWLFVAAINAKEMAAFLPAILFLYEWLYHRPVSWQPRDLATWFRKRGTFSLIMLGLGLLAFWAKSGPGSALYGVDLYKPTFTVRVFFANQRRFLEDLFLMKPNGANTTGVVLFYLSLFAGAWLTRRKYMWLLAWFVLLAPLPVIFIPYRELYEMYVPLAGLAMYIACALVPLRDWLAGVVLKQKIDTNNAWAAPRVTLFAAIAVLIAFTRNYDPASTIQITDPEIQHIAAYHDSLLRLNEPVPEHVRILLLNCQFPADDWAPLVITRELYRDTDLSLDRPTMMKNPPDAASYDRVIDFDGTNLVVTRRNPAKPVDGMLPPLHKPSN